MPIDIRNIGSYGASPEGVEKPPRPVRPQGVNLRRSLPLLLALIAALYYGYTYLTESEPWRMAETLVRQSPEIRDTVGEVRTCRLWYPFSIDFPDNTLLVKITILVGGAKAETKAYVVLKLEGEKWRIVDAAYEDGTGMVRPLLKKEKPAPKGGTVKPPPGARPGAKPPA